MDVLHTHWLMPRSPNDEGGLFVWAETAVSHQPSRDRRKKSAQPHPFTLTQVPLTALVRQINPTHQQKLNQHSVTLWLPTNKFGPTPSPELLHDWEQDAASPELRPWIVKGIRFSAREAFQFLVALNDNDVELRGVRLGGDGRYVQHLLNFTLEILAQQKLRPTLVEIRDGRDLRYEARWQPILDSEQDARRLTQLAATMPAICRADAPDPDETIPPRAILDSFLNHMVDAAARAWGRKQGFYLPTDS
ncbi:hypothetical protein MNBD_CHLOROFLEXI01-3977, partial [hydrothermal vent metagenome]